MSEKENNVDTGQIRTVTKNVLSAICCFIGYLQKPSEVVIT